MTRLEALIALRDAVREGKRISYDMTDPIVSWLIPKCTLGDAGDFNIACKAESIDAVLLMMGRVLPGWAVENWTIWPGIPSTVRIVGTHEGEDGTRWHKFKDGWAQAESETPARPAPHNLPYRRDR